MTWHIPQWLSVSKRRKKSAADAQDLWLALPTEQNDLLCLSLLLIVAPHFGNLALPVPAFFVVLWAYRMAVNHGRVDLPGRWPLLGLTAAGIGLVYFAYGRVYGLEGGCALFVAALGLKLLELRTVRDGFLAIYLGFFVAVTQYLFSQSIPMAVYTLAVVWLLVTVMIGYSGAQAQPLKARFRLAGVMIGQAIPVMVLLFVFFPRMAGPLWAMPDARGVGLTGLGETVEPGALTQLGLSREPAFRVDFDGPVPPARQLYWRGPVFWDTDGKRWTLPDQAERQFGTTPGHPIGEPVRYLLTQEPTRHRWVLALDRPAETGSSLTRTADFLLLASDTINERRQFRLLSYLAWQPETLSERDRRRGLRLPQPISTKLAGLIDGFRAQAPEPAQMVTRVLRHFREEPFYYTLTPLPLGDDPVESFLFETRMGFCEHYATAFVTLMRIAGIPARLITGYQGGTFNRVGNFLEVQQADAHAWAEVWLDGKGWVRVDPTAAVAPERVEQGLDVDLQLSDGAIRYRLADGSTAGGLGWLEVMRRSRELWAGVDHAWSRWVLSYSPEKQRRFWDQLGVTDWRRVAFWLFGVGGLLLGLVLIVVLPKPARPPKDVVVRQFERVLTRLARRGFVKAPGEGPNDFAARIASELGQRREEFLRLTALFVKLRYEPEPNAAERAEFRRRARRFRL